MSDRVLHCWEDLHDWAAQTYGWGSDKWAEIYSGDNATCMLPAGHEGPHQWTDDKKIGVTFLPDDSEPLAMESPDA